MLTQPSVVLLNSNNRNLKFPLTLRFSSEKEVKNSTRSLPVYFAGYVILKILLFEYASTGTLNLRALENIGRGISVPGDALTASP